MTTTGTGDDSVCDRHAWTDWYSPTWSGETVRACRRCHRLDRHRHGAPTPRRQRPSPGETDQ